MCDTGTLQEEVRKATSVESDVPLFTLQGGMDRSRFKGIDKLLISMLTKGLKSAKNRSEQDSRMLELLKNDSDFIRSENLRNVLDAINRHT